MRLHALILAGGRGTRFWPLSRRRNPKQLLELDDRGSLLRHTLDRLSPLIDPDDVWICTTEELLAGVEAQAPEIGRSRILAEPEGRNTAPAIAWSITKMDVEADDCVVVLPSDHWVANPAGFREALVLAFRAIEESDCVITLGVRPRWPETGYGYIELEEPVDELRVVRASRFVEKPDLATARSFVADGRHLWNAGIFLFRAGSLLRYVREHLPEVASALELMSQTDDPADLRELYSGMPAVSIDVGIMEKLDSIHCVPLDCGWSDLGSWAALDQVIDPTGSGSRARGEVIEIDGADNVLVADQGLVAVLGVEGLVVVRTADAVLVIPKERAQEVRAVVAELQRRRRDDLL